MQSSRLLSSRITSAFARPAFASTRISTPRFFHATPPAMTVTDVKTAADFKSTVAKDTVLVDCSAEWCGPCKMISPIFDKLSNADTSKGIQFIKIDVDELPEIAQELGVKAMPTFLLFHNGEKAGDMVGANPKALEELVKKAAGMISA